MRSERGGLALEILILKKKQVYPKLNININNDCAINSWKLLKVEFAIIHELVPY